MPGFIFCFIVDPPDPLHLVNISTNLLWRLGIYDNDDNSYLVTTVKCKSFIAYLHNLMTEWQHTWQTSKYLRPHSNLIIHHWIPALFRGHQIIDKIKKKKKNHSDAIYITSMIFMCYLTVKYWTNIVHNYNWTKSFIRSSCTQHTYQNIDTKRSTRLKQ